MISSVFDRARPVLVVLKCVGFVLTLVTVLGCVREIAPVSAKNALTALHADDLGLLVLVLDSEVDIQQIAFGGEHSFVLEAKHLADNRIIFVPLPAGVYQLEEIQIRLPRYIRIGIPERIEPLALHQFEKPPLRFTIVEKRLNYLGDLFCSDVYYDYATEQHGASLDMINRSSFLYVYLKEQAPQLLEQLSVHYVGFGTDDFFTEIRRIRENRTEVDR